jgi:hypothetical protein
LNGPVSSGPNSVPTQPPIRTRPSHSSPHELAVLPGSHERPDD